MHSITLRLVRSLPALLAGATLSLLAAAAASAAVTWHNVQFGGFISQGYLESSNDNNYPVQTEGGTFDFRQFAVNASTTFGTHLRVGAQVFGQKFGKYGGDQPALDWAVADYNFRPEIGVRVGRIKFPSGLYSEVLDLDILRPFIFLPQSNYDSRLRAAESAFNGAMAYGSINVGPSSFDYKIFYGDIPMKTDSATADVFNNSGIFANPPGATSLGIDSLHGATLNWNTPISGLRLGTSYSIYTNLAASGPFLGAPRLTARTNAEKFEYTSLSAEYTRGPWTFASEYMSSQADLDVSLPIMAPMIQRIHNRNFYLSAARRLGEKFEVGAYYSDTRNLAPAPTAAPASIYRHDWTVALRYDVNEHLLFKLEAHAITGTKDFYNVPGVSNPAGSLKDSMMLFAAKTTLSF